MLVAAIVLVAAAGMAVARIVFGVPVFPALVEPRPTLPPVSNAEAKADRLTPAAVTRPDQSEPDGAALALRTESFAALTDPSGRPDMTGVAPGIASPAPLPRPKPTAARRQTSYTLLSDIQIANLRDRMKLTPSQAQHWPAVETALRALAAQLHRQRKPGADPAAGFEADSAELQQLKAAAAPLLRTLREDQKREVRMLARIVGLEAVASQI